MNFLLHECTFLRFFMPLVLECRRRGIRSTMLMKENGKYNNPKSERNISIVERLAREHDFDLLDASEISHRHGETFISVEGSGLGDISGGCRSVVLTHGVDFATLYLRYENANHIIFSNRKVVESHGIEERKNHHYIGNPKYDMRFSPHLMRTKYNLDDLQRYALVVFPRLRDLEKVDMRRIYSLLKNEGFTILVKTRGKDPIPLGLEGDRSFEDGDWWPHPTQELLATTSLVVNFGSAANKECVFQKVPIINFPIKPHKQYYDVLHDFGYCRELHTDFSDEEFRRSVRELMGSDHEEEFARAKREHLFEEKDLSRRILDEII